jgi:hypothetical protein
MRQIHADLVIMQANNPSLRFDVQDKTGENIWVLETDIPCQFHSFLDYRLHERKFPETSLSDMEISGIVNSFHKFANTFAVYKRVANAAIKQYILDTEKESK